MLSIETLRDFEDPVLGPRKTLVTSSGTLTACGILDWDLETTTPFFAPGKASDGEDSFSRVARQTLEAGRRRRSLRIAEEGRRQMPSMTAATLVVYAGAYIFLVFFAVCLATGLYYLAELVEEHTRLTRKIIRYIILSVIGIHALLLLVDRLPLICIAIGIAAHALYYRLLKTFPYITLASTDFLASIGLLVSSHIVWIRFFMKDPRCAYVTVEWLVGFMLIVVWLTPFVFFISLAANESVLPGGVSGYEGFGNGTSGSGVSPQRGGEREPRNAQRRGRRTQGQLLGFFNFLRRKRDEVLPIVAQAIPATRKD